MAVTALDAPPHVDAGRNVPPLDRAVAATRGDRAPWALAATLPVLAVVLLAVALPVTVVALDLPRRGDSGAFLSLVGEVLLGAVILLAARWVARRSRGWEASLGVVRPARDDARLTVAWSGIQFGVRIAVVVLVTAAIPWMQHHPSSNLGNVRDLHALGVVLLLLAAVVVAPVVEEIAFRGLLLRALMRRLPFWAAAGISSVIFGCLHAPTANDVHAIPAVVISTTVFGVIQCLLVRHYGRLTPAIGVHAVANLLATGIAIAVAFA